MIGFPPDDGLQAVLIAYGIAPDALLGHGGEAWVYALDRDRVVRVLHRGGFAHHIRERDELVAELRSGGAPFELPEVLEIGEVEGRHYAIERRLPGRSLLEQLPMLDRPARDRLVEHHLDAAAALGNLNLQPRPWFGDLLGDDPVRSDTWRGYLVERLTRSLQSAPSFQHLDATELAAELPDTEAEAFVHIDAFAGNMLADGMSITAVLDIGLTSAVGDPRLDPLAAAVYLSSRQITPVATQRDLDVARSWLRAHELDDWFEPTRRWLAAYWSWAADDANLDDWCRTVLLGRD